MSGPRLSRSARLHWDRIGKRYLLLYPERGLVLNDSAAAILELCRGDRSVDAIVAEIARACPAAEAETVREDVTAFLNAMRKRGLIEPA